MLRGLQKGFLLRIALTATLSVCVLAACGDGGDSAAASAGSGSNQTTAGSSGTTTSTTSGTTAAPIAVTGSATLSWTPPLQNIDGSMLTDLAGYHIYYGTDLAMLNHFADLPWASDVVYIADGLEAGTWYFTVRAYNSAGVESDYSETASKTIG